MAQLKGGGREEDVNFVFCVVFVKEVEQLTSKRANYRQGSQKGVPTDKGGGREDDSRFCILFCICQRGGAADEEGGKGDYWVITL